MSFKMAGEIPRNVVARPVWKHVCGYMGNLDAMAKTNVCHFGLNESVKIIRQYLSVSKAQHVYIHQN